MAQTTRIKERQAAQAQRIKQAQAFLMPDHIDVAILGGGAAGLCAAITTAEATAKALAQAGLLNTENDNPDYRFYVSDIPLRFRTIGERFLGRSMEQIEMVTLG